VKTVRRVGGVIYTCLKAQKSGKDFTASGFFAESNRNHIITKKPLSSENGLFTPSAFP
jgi:hypothetical protein